MSDDKNAQKQDSSEAVRAFGLISAIGVDMAACTIGGTVLGKWLDSLWGTSPWLMLVGILVGLTGGVLGVIKLIHVFGPESKKR